MNTQDEIRISHDYTNVVVTDIDNDKPIIRKNTFETIELSNLISACNNNDINPLNCRFSKKMKMKLYLLLKIVQR